MKAYVTHTTALFYWRVISPARALPRSVGGEGLWGCCETVQDTKRINFPSALHGAGKLDLLVPDAGLRVMPREFDYHVNSRPYPPGSFLMVADDIWVASPELCFLQMGETLSVAGLIALGLELCGGYRLRPEGGFSSNCPPLASPASIARFLEAAAGHRGVKAARRAARFLLEGSASPMESALYERVCLPLQLGGYASPQPELNGSMALTRGQQNVARRSTLYGDLYWRDRNVLLEYDGERDHTGREKLTRDAMRDNAIASRHIRRLTVTADLYRDFRAFDDIMRELFRLLGERMRIPSGKQLTVRRGLPRELRLQEILTWKQQ